MPAESILVADGGFAGHWTGLLYDTKKSGRHFIPDRGFASIGYGLPGGIGAAEGTVAAVLDLVARQPRDVAAAATLLIRACTLWFGVALGAASLVVLTRRVAL